MKVYLRAKSKAAVNRALAEGESFTCVNHSLFGGGGAYLLGKGGSVPDGTIVAIYSAMSGGQPVAKSWGTYDLQKNRLK